MFMIPMIINALDDIINIHMNNKIEDVENVENAVNYEYVEEALCGYERRS